MSTLNIVALLYLKDKTEVFKSVAFAHASCKDVLLFCCLCYASMMRRCSTTVYLPKGGVASWKTKTNKQHQKTKAMVSVSVSASPAVACCRHLARRSWGQAIRLARGNDLQAAASAADPLAIDDFMNRRRGSGVLQCPTMSDDFLLRVG